MGTDFFRKCAPSFQKGLDRRRIELGTPDLFSRTLVGIPRAYAASVYHSEYLAEGDRLCVCLRGSQVIALRGISIVAEIRNPPADLVSGLTASFGEACGQVQTIHEMAGIAEIAVC
jgi:hypothetical protein